MEQTDGFIAILAIVIICIIGLSPAIIIVLLLRPAILDRAAQRRAWAGLQPGSAAGQFSEELLEGLPPLVQRYFRHSITPGASLYSGVSMRMDCHLQVRPGRGYERGMARLRLRLPDGMLMVLQTSQLGTGNIYHEHLQYGQGDRQFWFMAMYRSIRVLGPQTHESLTGQLAALLLWTPAMLLPQRGVDWVQVSDMEIVASFDLNGFPQALHLFIGPDGRMTRALRKSSPSASTAAVRCWWKATACLRNVPSCGSRMIR